MNHLAPLSIPPQDGSTLNGSVPAPLYDYAGPRASAMIESLRAFGYDLPTALADLIDNSISAGARRVWLHFHWDGSSSAVILRDDGCGMSQDELAAAMRPGSRSPLEERDAKDLGRFGLGLKTASFSQCRWLSVRTRRAGAEAATRCWNLDYVSECDEWRLLHQAPEGAEPYLADLDLTESGTVVLWQHLDRLVGTARPDDVEAQSHFHAAIEEVKRHLAMTFHDYLSGRGAVQIVVNGHRLAGWDAFLTGHEATQRLPEETVHWNDAEVVLTPYVLPHHTRLRPEEWDDAGGPHGWNAHQGFYIYRNRRLIVAGDWLGLPFGREEHYKLARIRIDLPNGADADWHLDVKKSSARPPAALRERLKLTAVLTRKRASDVYRHRGAKLMPKPGAERLHLWESKTRRGKRFYEINTEHPLVQSVLEASSNPGAVKALLRLAGETVPVPLIAINSAEDPQSHAAPFEQAATHKVQTVMQQVFRALCASGHSSVEARRRLAQMDAFERFPELIAALNENDEVMPDDGESLGEGDDE